MVGTGIIQWFLQSFGACPRCNQRFLDGLGGVLKKTVTRNVSLVLPGAEPTFPAVPSLADFLCRLRLSKGL